MTQIALSATLQFDKSTAVNGECKYIRAFNADLSVDKHVSKVEETTCIRANKAEVTIDKSNVKVTPTVYHALTANLNTDNSNISVLTNKINAQAANVYIDESNIQMKASVCHPFSSTIYVDNSNPNISFSTLRALNADIYTDKSSIKIEEFTRAILSEPPYGEMKVIVNGVDVSLNGFNAVKNGTYAINCLVYWDRLSAEGTKLIFTIKRSSNPDDEPYLIRESGEGITLLHVEQYGSSELEEYKAQIVLRPADMVRLPNKPTRVYYELRLEDSLNEDYIIERGNFIVNPSI